MSLTPLPLDQWDDNVVTALKGMVPRDQMNPSGAGNALSTLVRHPDLTKAFLGFNIYVTFRSTLPPRVRELTILRVATLADCDYETHSHLEIAREAGLSEHEISRAQQGVAETAFEQALLHAVDALHESYRLTDELWEALGELLDERQRMDFVFTVGSYFMVAMAFNTFGIRPDSEI